MIYKNKKIILMIVMISMLMQLVNPMVHQFSYAEEGQDLGNIFTFESLKLGNKEDGVEITEDSVIDVSDGTAVYLEYSWNTEGLNVEAGNYSEIQVPSAFELGENFPASDIIVNDGNKDVVVGTYTLTDGVLKFVFNENIETYGEVEQGYVGFGLEFNLESFAENVVKKIEFNGKEQKKLEVTVIPSGEITEIEKEGIPDADKDPKNITWTIDVVNVEETTIDNSLVWDEIPEGLVLDDNSIEIYDLNVGYNGNKTPGDVISTGATIRTGNAIMTSGASFEVDFDTMKSYQGYRIKYTTTIDDYSQTSFSNDAHLEYDDKNLSAVATIDSIERSDFIEKDGNKLDNNTISWSIDVNKPGGSIDEAIIDENLPTGLTLNSDSIEIYNLTKDGNSWTESLDQSMSFTKFPINIGSLDSNDVYRIKFTTDVDYTSVNGGDYQQDNSFENTAKLKDGTTLIGEAKKTVTITRDPILRKDGQSNVTYNDKVLSWTIHVNEANHLIKDAVVEDTAPIGLVIDEKDIKVYNSANEEVTPQSISVSGTSGTAIIVDLGDINTEYRKIKYVTEIVDFTKNTFENMARLTGDGVGTDGNSKNTPVSPPRNSYSKEFKSIDYNQKTMKWELRVNPRREALNTLKITDTFPNDGLIMLPDTLEVKIGDTQLTKGTDYTINANGDGYHKGFILEFQNKVLPLNNKITVTYLTSFDPEKVVEEDVLLPNNGSNRKYINSALFKGTTENENTVNKGKNAEKSISTTAWNSGKKEGKLVSLDNDDKKVDGWKSGNERKIQWEVYINYLEEELGKGISIEDNLSYDGEIDQDSIHIYEYTVAENGDTTITQNELDTSNYSTSFENNSKKLIVTFDEDFNVKKRYVLVLTTSVPKLSEETYTNNALLKVDEENEYPYVSSVGFEKYNNILSKEALSVRNNKVYTDQEVNWNIMVNESLSVIEDAQIVDTISAGMLYKNDSLKVYKLENSDRVPLTEGDGEDYTLSVDTSGDNTMLTVSFNETIDEYVYTIEYTTLVTAEIGYVNNSVVFSGTNITNETKESQKLSTSKFSWVGGTRTKEGTIKLKKVDESGDIITTGNADFDFGYKFNDEYFTIGDDVFSTNNGLLEIAIPNLDRTYYFKEITPPEGYLIPPEQGMEYEIYTDADDKDKIYELKIENTQIVADIEFKKVDEWDEPIQGAEFGLFDNSATPIVTASSLENGKVIFEAIPYGNYTIEEINPAEGYFSNNEVLEVTIGDDDHESTVYPKPVGETSQDIYSMENTIYKGSLDITKVDQNNNDKKLDGAEYSIFKLVDGTEVHIDTITTDENGTAELTDIPYGEYIVKESKAPRGYYLNSEEQSFQIINDGDSKSLTFENRKRPSNEEETKGSIRITKTDSEDEEVFLEGAVFEVRDSDDEVVDIITTDSNGKARIEDLSLGKYTIVETSAPDGYTIDDTEHDIRIYYTLDAKVNITNDKIDEVVPEEPKEPEQADDPVDPVETEEPEEPDNGIETDDEAPEETADFDNATGAPEPLPKTGDSGHFLIYIFVMILMLIGGYFTKD